MNALAARLAQIAALLKDPRTPRLPKLLVVAACLYLLSPVDLLPDFAVPVAGFLDDAMFWWFALRSLFRSGQPAPGDGRSGSS